MLDQAIHPNTKTILEAWKKLSVKSPDSLSGPKASDYPDLIGRLFVIQRAEDGVWPFRMAGESLCDLLGRELTDHDFVSLWRRADASLMRATLDSVAAGNRPGLMRGRAETLMGRRVEIEVAFAPLDVHGGARNRLLGLYQTLGGEPMLRGRPVWRHLISAIYPPAPEAAEPRIKLVASND